MRIATNGSIYPPAMAVTVEIKNRLREISNLSLIAAAPPTGRDHCAEREAPPMPPLRNALPRAEEDRMNILRKVPLVLELEPSHIGSAGPAFELRSLRESTDLASAKLSS